MATEVQRANFLGASIISFASSVGRNEEIGRFEAQLVEDPTLSQRFTKPSTGSAAYFEYGSFKFGGIIEGWTESYSPGGYPIFSVIVYDPRVILSACQVIIGEYGGPLLNIDNLFDVYGHYERQAFGYADRNDAGMPWRNNFGVGIEPALSFLIASRKIKFRGQNYTLNWQSIQNLPIPYFYRMGEGGATINLLELISVICQDANVDFIVNLTAGNIIVISTITLNGLQEGKIRQFIDSKSGRVESYEIGKELIDPNSVGGTTAGVLFGGSREDVNTLSSIYPFWGINPYSGALGQPQVAIAPTAGNGYENNDRVTVYAASIYDIIQQDYYPLSVIELKCALAGQSTWTTYLQNFEPEKINYISGSLAGEYDLQHIQDWYNHPGMMLQESREHILAKNNRFLQGDSPYERQKRVYEFVKGIAEEYWGKQFVVLIPFTTRKVESETQLLSWSYEPIDSGWSEGAPMGLAAGDADIFQDDYGKYTAFISFGPPTNQMDVTSLANGEFIISNNTIYVKCEVIPQVFLFNDMPACVVKVASPLYMPPQTDAGNLTDIASLFNVDVDKVQKLYAKQGVLSPLPLIHPGIVPPLQACIPLKNNTTTYGPWLYGSNRGGGVRVEHNASLVPWNYGGSFLLDDAGTTLWFGSFQGQQEKETGSVTVEGIPEKNLGEALISGGPIIDNISISVSAQGVRTSYRMETFIPRLGRFEQFRARRLSVLGTAAARQRREILQIRRRTMVVDKSKVANYFPKNRLNATIGNCGSSMLMATQVGDDDRKVVNAGVVKNSETLPQLAAADNEVYRTTAAMSVDGMFRPFSTNFENYNNELLSCFEEPIAGEITSSDINPFKDGHNISQVTYGSSYEGISPLKGSYSEDVRAISLRGPLVITGWGYDVRGLPVPNENETTPTKEYRDEHLLASDWWKSGPVDIKWDHIRKVWATSVILKGRSMSVISAGTLDVPGSGSVKLKGDTKNCIVYSSFSQPIPSNTMVQVGTIDDKLEIISAE